jgi:ribose/xylose/arabinose/galactoside ABC-type transport system permease subunit
MNATPPTTPARTIAATWSWRRFHGELGPAIVLALIVVAFAVADQVWSVGRFTSVRNLRVVLTEMSMISVAALGMTMVIIAGGIDLSAGAALTLCATLVACGIKDGYAPTTAVLAAVACGGLCGLANGLLVSGLRVVPFIVTLGTMSVYLGVGKILAGESTVSPDRKDIPEWIMGLCSTRPPDLLGYVVPNIAWGVWLALALAVLVAAILRYTVFGRYVYAVGSSEPTARLCGVNVPVVKIAVYTLAGLFVGVAGVYLFSQVKLGNPSESQGLELDAIAAVVIGGGSLSGGRGSVLGTLTGAAIMGVIRSGCDQLDIANSYQNVITGAMIVAAVALDQIQQRRLAHG